MDAEWVVYAASAIGSPRQKYACESISDWESYKELHPRYPADEQLVARGLTEAQAKAMVALSKGET